MYAKGICKQCYLSKYKQRTSVKASFKTRNFEDIEMYYKSSDDSSSSIVEPEFYPGFQEVCN